MNRRKFLAGVGAVAGGSLLLPQKVEAEEPKSVGVEGYSHEQMVLMIVATAFLVELDGKGRFRHTIFHQSKARRHSNYNIIPIEENSEIATGLWTFSRRVEAGDAVHVRWYMKSVTAEHWVLHKTEIFDISDRRIRMIKFCSSPYPRYFVRRGEEWQELGVYSRWPLGENDEQA